MEIWVRLAGQYKSIIVLMILIASSSTVSAQDTALNTFKSYAAKNYRIPDTVFNDCNWNYAIVKASIGSNNKVEDLTFLNEVGPEMKESFGFLRGYSFGSDRTFKGKAVIFTLTVELDNWHTCNTGKIDYSPTQAITRVLSVLDKELSINPSSLVLYYPIIVTKGHIKN